MSSPASTALDGLWRCLHPSIDATFLARASQCLPNHPLVRRSHGWRRFRAVCQARHLHTDHPYEEPSWLKEYLSPAPPKDKRVDRAPAPPKDKRAGRVKAGDQEYDNTSWGFANVPTKTLLRELENRKNSQGQEGRIVAIVQHLVKQRGLPYDVRLLEALVVANWDTRGSAARLTEIMDLMGELNLTPDSAFYHSALRLLTVHPDYLMRTKILHDMKSRHIVLNRDGKVSVALGYLRDGQDEMALDYLEEMIRYSVGIPAWVFDIFIFVLGKKGCVEESLRLMLHRPETTNDGIHIPSTSMWYFLLDKCSESYCYRGTKFIWDKMVQGKTLEPSDGMVTAVLETAARHADADLATQAIKELSQRSVKLGRHHYEALVDCYLEAGDMENAFRVLAIMRRAGIFDSKRSVDRIAHALGKSPEPLETRPALLLKLSETSDLTPEAELLVVRELCEHGETRQAVRFFQDSKMLHTEARENSAYVDAINAFFLSRLRGDDATVEDARLVLSALGGQHIRDLKGLGMEALRRACYLYAIIGDVDSSFDCLEQLKHEDNIPTRYILCLVEECLSQRDPRVWGLFDRLRPSKFENSKRMAQLRRIQEKLVSMRGEHHENEAAAAKKSQEQVGDIIRHREEQDARELQESSESTGEDQVQGAGRVEGSITTEGERGDLLEIKS